MWNMAEQQHHRLASESEDIEQGIEGQKKALEEQFCNAEVGAWIFLSATADSRGPRGADKP